MGLLDFLSAGLTAGTQGASGWLQGQEKGRQESLKEAQLAAQMLRQKHIDEQNALLQNAQIGHLNKQSEVLGTPKPPEGFTLGQGQQRFDAEGHPIASGPPADDKNPLIGSPEWQKAEIFKARLAPSPITYIQGVNPETQKPEIYAGTTRGAPSLKAMGIAKPETGKGGGSMSLTPEDRSKMKAQMQLDAKTMSDIEDKWKNEGSAPGATTGSVGAMSELHGGFRGMIAPFGNKAVGTLNPDYQKYLAAQRSFGRLAGNLQSKRYSDVQAEIERSISGLAGSDLQATLDYKKQLRDATINDPSTNAPEALVGSGGGKPSLAIRIQQLKTAGASKDQARTALKAEGYVVP